MSDIVRQAKSYLKANAAESGADVLIEEMVKEIEELWASLVKARDYIDPQKEPCQLSADEIIAEINRVLTARAR